VGAASFAPLSKGCGGSVPMRNKLKRYYGMGHFQFLTFSSYPRKPLLGTVRALDWFVRILDQVRARSVRVRARPNEL
jgi:hypothetical protein